MTYIYISYIYIYHIYIYIIYIYIIYVHIYTHIYIIYPIYITHIYIYISYIQYISYMYISHTHIYIYISYHIYIYVYIYICPHLIFSTGLARACTLPDKIPIWWRLTAAFCLLIGISTQDNIQTLEEAPPVTEPKPSHKEKSRLVPSMGSFPSNQHLGLSENGKPPKSTGSWYIMIFRWDWHLNCTL